MTTEQEHAVRLIWTESFNASRCICAHAAFFRAIGRGTMDAGCDEYWQYAVGAAMNTTTVSATTSRGIIYIPLVRDPGSRWGA